MAIELIRAQRRTLGPRQRAAASGPTMKNVISQRLTPLTPPPRPDTRLWQDRLFRQTYRNNGRLHRTSHCSASIQHEGLAGFGTFAFTV
jgi:hypothetical protein